ncbi:MAG TPA: heavy metal translocating P-type ATPase [Atribacteraceae bacterium]|nr:heavy metal translocating P-type ATPase [Atribacteraceae bacterium]
MTEGKTTIREYTVRIEGMTCGSCAANIEKVLGRHPGVKEATVNFPLKTARLLVEERVDLPDLLAIINHLGYQGTPVNREETKPVKEVHFNISGMTCTACSAAIEKALRKIEGVAEATVNFAERRAHVRFDSFRVGTDELIARVEKLGYGMSLIERSRNSDAYSDRELRDAQRKLVLAWGLAAPVGVVMIIHMLGYHSPVHMYLQLLLSFPVIFVAGYTTLRMAFLQLVKLQTGMDTLIAFGTLASYASGLLKWGGVAIENYAAIGAMIMAFHLTGRYLEAGARSRATREIARLLELGVRKARVEKGGDIVEIDVDGLVPGDIMHIKPGEKVPQDGTILEGTTTIDESMISGEPLPVVKKLADPVTGATINLDGFIKVRVDRIGEESFLSQIIRMVENAQGTKVPIQAFADRVSSIFTPLVILTAGLSFVTWYFLNASLHPVLQWGAQFLPWIQLDLSPLSLALTAGIATLVIACPCALGLATPTALMVGTGMSAKRGILFRSGEAVQTMKDVDVVLLDKTGTITSGTPQVNTLVTDSKMSREKVLDIAYALEKYSEHPLSRAILQYARSAGVTEQPVRDFQVVPGKGVKGSVGERTYYAGSHLWVGEMGVPIEDSLRKALEDAGQKAATPVLVFDQQGVYGVFALSDTVKPESRQGIADLRKSGRRTVLLTGDHQIVAHIIGDALGVDEIEAELLPQDKMRIVKKYQAAGHVVAMVGDGINDAPALKQANVGIAMGSGTDIAKEAGDVVLIRPTLGALVEAFRISEMMFRKIKQNLFWAFFYNTVALPIAFLGMLHPLIAEIAMAASSVNVVTNSLRLKKMKL